MRDLYLTNPEMNGADVQTLQRLLNKHGALPKLTLDAIYGPHTADAVVAAKRKMKFSNTTRVAGAPFISALEAQPLPPPPVDPYETTRVALVQSAEWMISNRAKIGYMQIRPRQGRVKVVPFDTDCSGSTTDAYEWETLLKGIRDPNGGSFGPEAYTGLMLQNMTHIVRDQWLRGDLCVFGAYPGKHVVMKMTDDADPWVFSHGHAGSPDDPEMYKLQTFLDYFGADSPNYLTIFDPQRGAA